MKQLILTVLNLLLLFAVPPALKAQFGFSTNGDGTLTITNYTGAGGDLILPSNFDGLTVSGLGYQAFAGNTNITSVTIPATITNVGYEVFYLCSDMTNFTLYNSIIGTNMFGGCQSLTSIAIPSNITTICDAAFLACPLTNVTFTNGLINIGAYIFSGAGFPLQGGDPLLSVVIPDTVTNIGESAFYACLELTNVVLGASLMTLGESAFGDCYDLMSVTIQHLGFIPEDAFQDCSRLTSVALPNGLTNIGDYAFQGCSSLSNVTIPSGVTSVGEYAFYGCGVTNVFFSDTVKIGPWSFAECQQLTNVSISGTAMVGSNAFYTCTNLTSVYIAGGAIGYGAFETCNSLADYPGFGNPKPPLTGLQSVILGNGVTSIGDWAFAVDQITNLIIPDSVTNIGAYSIGDCPITSLVIPGSVAEIGTGAFEGCPLTNVTLSFGVTTIDGFAFYGAPLTSITFPGSLTSIGASAFYVCEDLASNIIIPASVTQIAASSFAFCPATNMLFLGNAPTITGDQGAPFLNYGSTNATVYYLPGTSGWGATYGGDYANQTALWNSAMEGAVVSNGQFGFNVTGTPNIPVVVEACTNLANPVWTPLQSMTLTNGSVYFSDPNWTNYPARYYGIGFP